MPPTHRIAHRMLSPPKARSPCLQRACNGCRGPGWHCICICRPPKPFRLPTSEVHRRALQARVCYVPAGDAAHAAVIAHCSIIAACALSAPASVKTRTGDVRRRYVSLRFSYRIRRRPAAEMCTAGCGRGLSDIVFHKFENNSGVCVISGGKFSVCMLHKRSSPIWWSSSEDWVTATWRCIVSTKCT